MTNKIKKIYSYLMIFVLTILVAPLAVFASHDSSGKPVNLHDKVYVAIYNGEGFPGEPAIYGTSLYTNFNSRFEKVGYTSFSNSAEGIFKESIIEKLVQGTSSGSQKVWGLYNANGTRDYFADNSPLLSPENELKIIREIKGNPNATLDQYEIVWYVIKYQSGNGWYSVDDWHIDGVIKEKNTYSVNYYGNGNTSGSAPLGTTGIAPGGSYEVLGNTGNLQKIIAGVNYPFLGWSTNPNDSVPMYQAGDEITNINRNISLYAIFDNHIDYLVNVNTYLDNVLTDIDIILPGNEIYLKKSTGTDYINLNKSAVGKYNTSISNGTYDIWLKNNNQYSMVEDHQLVVDNDTEEINLHYYSVTYNTNGGTFNDGNTLKRFDYFTGDTVNAIDSIPERDGYIFKGWSYNNNVYNPNAVVTNSIKSPIILVAKWEKLINIKLNVTIDHVAENGEIDESNYKDYLIVELLRKNKGQNPYIETGLSKTFSDAGVDGFDYIPTNNNSQKITLTKYLARDYTFVEQSNEFDYTITTNKTHYDVVSVENIQDSETGDWTINVTLKYNPSDFDIEFSVKMDNNVPKSLYPTAVIVKIAHYEGNVWELIPQHVGNVPGVRVNIDKTTGSGTGSYSVLKYILDNNNEPDTNNPYGYRIIVTAFVYEDGSIVPVTNNNIGTTYTDNNYEAAIGSVSDGRLFGELNGAYYGGASDQVGTLEAIVSVKSYKVTFNAMGGTVNGQNIQEVLDLYQVPSFSGYTPIRDNYQFKGWYLDQNYQNQGIENVYLTDNIVLYAKWNAIQNLTGSIKVDGTYIHSNATVEVWDRDLPTHVTVLLQELIKGPSGNIEHIHNIDSQDIEIEWDSLHKLGTSKNNYMFTNLDGSKTYRIDVLLANFMNHYQNEDTIIDVTAPLESNYNLVDYTAVYIEDPINTFVNVYLDFNAEAYFQVVEVDSTAVGENYRPNNAHTQIVYKLVDEYDDSYHIISQHTISPFGINIGINQNGIHDGVYGENLWKAMWNGKRYIYQAQLSDITIGTQNIVYNALAPYTVSYGMATGWNPITQSSSGPLQIIITPNTYNIIYDLNTTDTVTNMDNYLVENEYRDTYTWSFGKLITATPERVGYKFIGWSIDGEVQTITEIAPSRYGDITLIANWEKDLTQTKKVTYTVQHDVDGTIKDVKEYEEYIWINAEDELEVKIDSLKANKYEGYKFKEVINNIQEGDIVSDGTTITLVYEKDSFTYVIEYYYDDVIDNSKTENLEAVYKEVINNYIDKLVDNYVLDKVEGLPLTIDYQTSKNVIKVFYLTDKVGGGDNGEESDNIADKYQKKVTFKIVNGTWTNDNKDIIKYLTLLDEEGNYSINGSATLEIPTDMKANYGYENGKWDIEPSSIVAGTKDEVYTYSYEKIVINEEVNPQTFDGIIRSIFMAIISIIGLVVTAIFFKKEMNRA